MSEQTPHTPGPPPGPPPAGPPPQTFQPAAPPQGVFQQAVPQQQGPAPRRRGRPVLGAISGLFFGLFLALDLLLGGALALNSIMIVVLPILGLVLGAALGWWAPLKR